MKRYRMLVGTRGLAVFVGGCLSAAGLYAQPTANGDTIRGVVINSITREPVARALVESVDERFGTLTNSEGRFEFAFPKPEQGESSESNRGSDSTNAGNPVSAPGSYRPFAFVARKPGFLQEFHQRSPRGGDLRDGDLRRDDPQDLTIELTPEALIVGTVRLPTAEAPDSITVQLFRLGVRDGRARYVQAGMSGSRSDGEFRFADLGAGTYKLLTHELLDSDPATLNPDGTQFGYPPVFYPNAADFESAGKIEVSAGQTQTVILSLVKQPYYRVKVPVTAVGGAAVTGGVNVSVSAHGRGGPGFALAYSPVEHAITGLLPNGTYMIEAGAFGPNGDSSVGMKTITVKGAAVEGPGMTMVPQAAIPVNVKEEFTGADPIGRTTWNMNGRNVVVKGPRRYLNVLLEAADEVGVQRAAALRNPTNSADEPLMIDGPPPGRYWVRVDSSRGYAASVRSGNLDLQHQPLVVGVGGAVSPIEVTMRDETGEISGKVEGVAGTQQPAQTLEQTVTPVREGMASYSSPEARTQIYCVPVAESSGQFKQISASPDGSFDSEELPPGSYRLLAFDREQPELEYRDPEAMRAYDSKGPLVTVAAGQKVQVTVQLISTENTSH